jgi:hypothetical protein
MCFIVLYLTSNYKIMTSKQFLPLLITFFSLIQLTVFAQGTDPHTQIHKLNRGAYVMCVDEMANQMSDPIVANRDTSKLDSMILNIDKFELNYVAFYGIDKIVDIDPNDDGNDSALRYILQHTRTKFPKIEIGIVAGKDSIFENILLSEFPYNPTSEICETKHEHMTPSEYELSISMNPQTGSSTAGDIYHASVLRFITRILWYFNGDYSINTTQGFQQGGSGINNSGFKGLKESKGNSNNYFSPPIIRKDYFDWISFEHEYWNGNFIQNHYKNFSQWYSVDSAYYYHKQLIIAIYALLAQNQGCHMEVESYENLMLDGQLVLNTEDSLLANFAWTLDTSMNDQAQQLRGLPDRILFTNYSKWPDSYVDRYCLAINAWGEATSGRFTEFWPLFSVERPDSSQGYYCSNNTDPWGNYLGRWMDTSYYAYPDLARPGYPYEIDEFEDEYLRQYDSAAVNGTTDNSHIDCNCCPIGPHTIDIGTYEPEGFMWFTVNMMKVQKITKRVSVNISIEFEQSPILNIYPNPAKQLVNLPNYNTLRVIDVQGKLIPTKLLNKTSLDVRLYPPGLYLLVFNLTSTNKPTTVKLLIE